MYRVLACFSGQHDLRLVLLAASICAIASVVAFRMYSHAREDDGWLRWGWLFLTGTCAGAGIWTTHFIAMLAYEPGIPTSFSSFLTLASLLVTAAVTTAGFSLAVAGRPSSAIAGGSLIGCGIGLMHFLGMQALVVPGAIDWDYNLVLVSLVVGCGLSSSAMIVFNRCTTRHSRWHAPCLLVLAIFGLHFTAMGAVTITPDPTALEDAANINHAAMAVAIAGAALLVLLTGLIAALIDGQSHRATQRLLMQLMARERELQVQNDRFDTALANMSQGLSLFDKDRRLVVCNERYALMYGLTPDQVKPGTTVREIVQSRIDNGFYAGISAEGYLHEQQALVDELKPWNRIQKLNDGRIISVVYRPMVSGGFLITHEDITEQRRAEDRIAHMARHDALTDLPNRTLLGERLEAGLARVRRGESLAVHCLDLDRFKEVNDELGHPVGDALLKEVACRLRTCVRDTDTIARLGGDEFAVVQIPAPNPATASMLATRIVASLTEPYVIDGHHVRVGASIGIAMAPADGLDSEEILRNADLALYRAKLEPGGSYRFFEPEMNARMQYRRSMERDLRNALTLNQIEVYYQPLMNLGQNEISGFEALARWQHPHRGLMSPSAFIPLAEETGLIGAIGEWVLREACQQAKLWPAHLTVAVNVSVVQFRSRHNLVNAVANALAASGLAAERLQLEITESVLLQDSGGARACLEELHLLGVKLALDDFGTGYSSLSYLRKFPFDKIKIDRCFIKDLEDGGSGALAIVRAVAQLGKTLGMVTTAEGVETEEQLEIVRAEGCTEMQGYLLSPPRTASDIATMFLGSKVEAAA